MSEVHSVWLACGVEVLIEGTVVDHAGQAGDLDFIVTDEGQLVVVDCDNGVLYIDDPMLGYPVKPLDASARADLRMQHGGFTAAWEHAMSVITTE